MSYASASYQCTYIQDAATFTIALIGATGDLVQMYRGDALTATDIMPSWATDHPVISVVLMSSDPAATDGTLSGMVNNAATRWSVNGEELKFNNAGVSTGGSYDGLFGKIGAGAEAAHPFGGLRVLGNLVRASAGAPLNVTCILGLDVGNTIAEVQAAYTIRVFPMKGDSTMAEVYCDPGQSFALDDGNTQVTAKVRLWKDGAEVASTDYSVRWHLFADGAWMQKSTAAAYTISRDDIATFGQVKAECWSKDAVPVLLASDMQTVSDASDPFIIYPNPTPADGRLRQSGGPSEVKFEPKLERVSGGSAPTGVSYLFAVMDPGGTVVNTDDQTKQKTYTVPKSVFENMQAGPVVNITAVGS